MFNRAPTRREFLRNVTAATLGAALGPAARVRALTPQGQGGRRPVTIGGRRVKVIDVHAHCAIPEAASVLAGTPLASNGRPAGNLVVGPERIRAMDAQGIDVEVLSINPFWYSADRDLAARLIDVQNQKLAEICRAYPDRFAALASVALQHPDLAAEQLEAAVKTRGMRGAAIGGHVNADELSAARLDPFWAKAEALEALIFIHPQGIPEVSPRLAGNGFLTNVIGNPLETTIALSHLIFDGVLDRFPRLRVAAAHGGGYLPAYSARSDHGCVAFPANCRGALAKHPTEYLKQMYFDSLVFTGEELRHLVAECGASQIVVGTDYPYPWTTTAVDHVLETPGLSDNDRVAILGGNAAKLLGIPL